MGLVWRVLLDVYLCPHPPCYTSLTPLNSIEVFPIYICLQNTHSISFCTSGFAASRHLLFHRGGRKENCTIPAIDEFPAGFFTKEQRLHGAVVIHLIVAVYILVILGIICNEYFVPAIEKFVSCEYM